MSVGWTQPSVAAARREAIAQNHAQPVPGSPFKARVIRQIARTCAHARRGGRALRSRGHARPCASSCITLPSSVGLSSMASVQSGDLAGVRAKLQRARAHIEAFNMAMRAFFETDPTAVRMERDTQTNVVAIYWGLRSKPPLNLATVAGDAIQNMRAALDYLAWELVLASGGNPSEATQFPIHTSMFNHKGNRRQVTVKPGIDPAAERAIERLQPYNRTHDPHAHPLAMLRKLANHDKHRQLTFLAARSAETKVVMIDPASGESRSGQFGVAAVDDEGLAGVIDFSDLGYIPDWQPQTHGSVFITFEEPRPNPMMPAIDIMDVLYEYVESTVVPTLKQFLT